MVILLRRHSLAVVALAVGLGCAKINTAGGDGTAGGGGGGAAAGVDASPRGTSRDAISPGSDFEGTCQHALRAGGARLPRGEKDGQPSHPDFEYTVATDMDRGEDAGAGHQTCLCRMDGRETTGQANFASVVQGRGRREPAVRDLHPAHRGPARPGVNVFDSDLFFSPGRHGVGQQYLPTIRTSPPSWHFHFPYRGGEIFTFAATTTCSCS